jgi:hypothetical protein
MTNTVNYLGMNLQARNKTSADDIENSDIIKYVSKTFILYNKNDNTIYLTKDANSDYYRLPYIVINPISRLDYLQNKDYYNDIKELNFKIISIRGTIINAKFTGRIVACNKFCDGPEYDVNASITYLIDFDNSITSLKNQKLEAIPYDEDFYKTDKISITTQNTVKKFINNL